ASIRCRFRVRSHVERNDAATKPAEDTGGGTPDPAGPHDTDRLAVEIEANEAIEGEVPLADASVSAVDLAIERQNEGHRMLGDRMWGVFGHSDHGKPDPPS